MKKLLVSLAALALTIGIASSARADDTATASNPGRGVITLKTTPIYGRVQKPQVVIQVSKMEPMLTLSTLEMPFIGRIEGAISTSPF
jgi:hypothetical protein